MCRLSALIMGARNRFNGSVIYIMCGGRNVSVIF